MAGVGYDYEPEKTEAMTVHEWFRSGVKYDGYGTQIWAIEKKPDADYLHHVADIRGWGEIQNMFKDENEAMSFQDAIGQYVVDAINEKLERDKTPNNGTN